MKILALLLLSLPSSVFASSECRELVLDENDVGTIEASLNHATHLILPEPIVRDVAGDPRFWTFAGPRKNSTDNPLHYWIKPGDEEPDTETTSLSLITASRSYDFLLKRVAKGGALCVRINEPETFGEGSISAQPLPNPVSAALPAFTRYHWRHAALESVYDDGRYTYLRLSPRAEGAELPNVSGGTKKRPVLIEARYDALTRTFTVPGIHPQLLVSVDGRDVAVERGDE